MKFLKAGSLAAAAAILCLAGATATMAEEGQSRWQIRGRLIGVLPDESASISTIGGDVDIDDAFVPEVDFTYFLDEHWSLELIAATSEHDVSHTPTGLDLGSAWVLPPTLLLQYHFNTDAAFQPYVGAGINYTIFYNVDEPTGLSLDYENTWNGALQVGFDYFLDSHQLLNIDVKKIFIETEVSINGGAIMADVEIHPWVIGVGYGYRF